MKISGTLLFILARDIRGEYTSTINNNELNNCKIRELIKDTQNT